MRWTLALALAMAACDDGGAEPSGADARATADASRDAAPDARPPDARPPDATPPDVAPPDATPDMEPQGPPHVPEEQPLEGPLGNGAAEVATAVAAGRARAGRVSEDRERVTGPEASCRVGDFRLDNALVTACVLAEHGFSQITDAGGQLADAHRADRPGTDMLAELIIAPGLGEVTVERVGVVRDGSGGGMAVVRVEGRAEGSRLIQNVLPGNFVPFPARVVTEYRLLPDRDTIDLLTWLEADGAQGGRLFLTDMVYMGDRLRGLVPGAPPGLVGAGAYAFIAAEGEQVSYAFLDGDGAVDIFSIPISDAPFVVARQPAVFLRPGDRYLYRRHLRVGTGDVESVRAAPPGAVDQRFEGPAGARVEVRDAEEKTVTAVRLGPGGGVARLAPGRYEAAVVAWPGGAPAPVVFEAGEGVVRVEPPAPARLRVSIRDGAGEPLTARVQVRGPIERTVFVRGDQELLLPAGAFTVTTTHGWHFTADERAVSLVAGEAVGHAVTLEEVIPTPGWASGEFHQHAAPSLDATLAVEDRILSNIAEGVSFMVPSEHDVIYDYASLARRTGLDAEIAVPLSGVEISPIFTHIGAYGIPYDASAAAGGAPPLSRKIDGRWRGLTVPELIGDARARGARVIQINHPRDGGDTKSYFVHTDFRPEVAIETLDARRFTPDFDTLEIFNDNAQFCAIIADWLSLLNQGLRVTGVGNSDTHGETDAAGYPRNYLPAVDPRRVTGDEVEAAMKGGVATVGAGAYLDLPDGPLPGAEVVPAGGVVSLRVRIRTPPYTRVQRLIAFHNGVAVVDRRFEPEALAIVDFDEVVDIPVDRDGPIVLLAAGDGDVPFVKPGNPVFAFANPLWANTDGGDIAKVGAGPITLPELALCR